MSHAESDELRSQVALVTQTSGRCADASGSAGGENVFVYSSRIRRRLQRREPSPVVGERRTSREWGRFAQPLRAVEPWNGGTHAFPGMSLRGGGLLSGGAFGGPLALAGPRFERLRGPRGCVTGDGGGCRWCLRHAIWGPVRRRGGARRGWAPRRCLHAVCRRERASRHMPGLPNLKQFDTSRCWR